MGEAAKRLSPEFRARHAEFPWKGIAGMRDKMIHAYEEIDLKEVWKTTTVDLPPIIERLGPLVGGRDGESGS